MSEQWARGEPPKHTYRDARGIGPMVNSFDEPTADIPPELSAVLDRNYVRSQLWHCANYLREHPEAWTPEMRALVRALKELAGIT